MMKVLPGCTTARGKLALPSLGQHPLERVALYWLVCVIRSRLAAGAGANIILGRGVSTSGLSGREPLALHLSSGRILLVFLAHVCITAHFLAQIGSLQR